MNYPSYKMSSYKEVCMKEKFKEGWKLCQRVRDKGESNFFSAATENEFRIQYKEGLNYALEGTLGIFIFSKKLYAKYLVISKPPHDLVAIKCFYNPDTASLPLEIPTSESWILRRFYGGDWVCPFLYMDKPPLGTLCVPWINIPKLEL